MTSGWPLSARGRILATRMLRVVEDHLRPTQVSCLIYGAIMGLALVVAEVE